MDFDPYLPNALILLICSSMLTVSMMVWGFGRLIPIALLGIVGYMAYQFTLWGDQSPDQSQATFAYLLFTVTPILVGCVQGACFGVLLNRLSAWSITRLGARA